MGILVEHQKAITQMKRRICELETAARPPLTLVADGA
jgi:F0F1-type ATP synthase epsilon subunit